MPSEIDIMDNRTGHPAGAGDVARERGMRSRMRAHNSFEVHPATREGVALIALIALTPAACRTAMPGPGTGDKKPGAERAERAETPAAMPVPPQPAATAQAASDRQHHPDDMVRPAELGMRLSDARAR